MSTVARMLTGEIDVPIPTKHASVNEDWITGALKKLSSDSQPKNGQLHNSPGVSEISQLDDENVPFHTSASESLSDASRASKITTT